MLKVSHVKVHDIEAAIRGMRNSYKSWDKSDSNFSADPVWIGAADKKLMLDLIHGGTSHSKFQRVISTSFDVTAPMYWWNQFATYGVGVTCLSTSNMHSLVNGITLDDFSLDALKDAASQILLYDGVEQINRLAKRYKATNNNEYLREAVALMPMCFNYTRTVGTNYMALFNIYNQRRNHKLDEWRTFCDELEKFPYSFLITGGD